MILMIAGTITNLSVFVMPKYRAIFRDFHVQMPAITEYTFSIAYAVAPVLLLLVVLFILVAIGRMLWQVFHPMRQMENPARAFLDVILWVVPISHSYQRDAGLADLFDFLADALDAGTPADKALLEAQQLRLNLMLQRKLARWHRLALSGERLGEAASDAGFPALVSGMLGISREAQDSAAVLRFLSRYYQTRFSRLVALIQGAAAPAIVFFFAILVACVVLSMFVPLTRLIDSIAPRMAP
jgi:type II secretory pathway component PulF